MRDARAAIAAMLINVGGDPAYPFYVEPAHVRVVGGPAFVTEDAEVWEATAWIVIDGHPAPLPVPRTGVAYVMRALRGQLTEPPP